MRHTTQLLSGAMVANVCNFAYQIVMGRNLTPNEYSILAALLGFIRIVNLPLSSIGIAVTHYSALLVKLERYSDVRRLTLKWLLRMSLLGLPVVIVALTANRPLTELFNLNRGAPVIIMGITLAALFCQPIIHGALQGLQRFSWVMVATKIEALVRLLTGGYFVIFIMPAAGWGLLGHGLGIYAGNIIVGIVLLGILLKYKGTSGPVQSIRSYSLQSFIILLGYAVLMNADMILVRNYLPDEAGHYAYASMISKIIIFTAVPLAKAMFPKVVSEGGRGEHRDVLRKSILYTLFALLPAVAGCLLLPQLPLRIFYGLREPAPELLNLVRLLSVGMFCVAFTNVLLHFYIAQRSFKAVYHVAAIAILYVGYVYFNHDSVWDVAWSSTIAGFASAALSCVQLLIKVPQTPNE